MIPLTFLYVGSFQNVTWTEDQTGRSKIESGYGPLGEHVYRNKAPIGSFAGKDVWLVHCSSIEQMENLMEDGGKIITWKQAKLDKAAGLIDFVDEQSHIVETAQGSEVQTTTTLHVIAGGGAPEYLDWENPAEDVLDRVVEIRKEPPGLLISTKARDK